MSKIEVSFNQTELAAILLFIQFGLRHSGQPKPRAEALINQILTKIENAIDANEDSST